MHGARSKTQIFAWSKVLNTNDSPEPLSRRVYTTSGVLCTSLMCLSAYFCMTSSGLDVVLVWVSSKRDGEKINGFKPEGVHVWPRGAMHFNLSPWNQTWSLHCFIHVRASNSEPTDTRTLIFDLARGFATSNGKTRTIAEHRLHLDINLLIKDPCLHYARCMDMLSCS